MLTDHAREAFDRFVQPHSPSWKASGANSIRSGNDEQASEIGVSGEDYGEGCNARLKVLPRNSEVDDSRDSHGLADSEVAEMSVVGDHDPVVAPSNVRDVDVAQFARVVDADERRVVPK